MKLFFLNQITPLYSRINREEIIWVLFRTGIILLIRLYCFELEIFFAIF